MDWTQLWGNDDDDEDGSGPGDDDHNDNRGSYDEGWCQFLMMIKAGSKGSWLFFNQLPAHMHWSHPTCSPPQSVIIFTSIWWELTSNGQIEKCKVVVNCRPPSGALARPLLCRIIDQSWFCPLHNPPTPNTYIPC